MIFSNRLNRIWKFRGGIKLPGSKSLSNAKKIKTLPIPPQLIFPLKQHIGEPATPIVNVGDYVYKGQVIAETSGYISATVHASSSGTITAIENHSIPHATVIQEKCVVIDTDGKDEWHHSIAPIPKPMSLSSVEIRQRIRDAGIVGLGGAVFPSAVKLKPTREIETLVINGVECEPYITCDDVLMRFHAEKIIRGALLLARIIKPHEIVIAIEDNKTEACENILDSIYTLKEAGVTAVSTINVTKIPTIFPTGGEKQLIKVLTGKEVPSGSLPYEIGVVCLNVGTTAAVYDALYKSQPLISRITTVTGNNLIEPTNYHVLLGTPIRFVLEQTGFENQKNSEVIMGGPMMGITLSDLHSPVIKATNCLLVQNSDQIRQPFMSMPCIRCGQCAVVCPMNLLPQQLHWYSRSKSFEKLSSYHINDCIECGCCQVVCPSKIPLVHYFRFAKSHIKAQERETKKAAVSRLRNETRQLRLNKLKQEQEERKAKRKAMRKNTRSKNTTKKNEPLETAKNKDIAMSESGKIQKTMVR